jgi:NACHT domain
VAQRHYSAGPRPRERAISGWLNVREKNVWATLKLIERLGKQNIEDRQTGRGIGNRVKAVSDRSKRYAWLWGGTSLLLGAVGVATAIALSSEPSLDTADKLSSVGSLVLGTAGLIVGILSFAVAIRGPAAQTDEAWAAAATADLAAQVRRQWRGEQHLRRLDGSDLLRTSWTSTTREVAAPPAEVLAGAIGGRPTRLRLAGTIDKVGSVFRGLPHRRLVVLGEPGAGKSVLALALTLQLLEGRGPDDSVPVLLVLSAWDTREDLESWLVRRLAEEYPSVTPMPKGAATGYRDLLRKGRILPILDGLDELPAELRVRALTALSLAAAQGQAFALTCRFDEYAAVVEQAGRPMPGAAVVEIAPLTGSSLDRVGSGE